MNNWKWFRDRWQFEVPIPQYNTYYVGGTVRPYKGIYIWDVYENRQLSIKANRGSSITQEEAEQIVEKYYGTRESISR